MATLRAIRKRIKSAGNIQQITKAMKMVSAAKLRKAQTRITAARPYAIKIAEVIDELIVSVRSEKNRYPLLAENIGVKKDAIILITSDKGLCGSFNVNLVKAAFEELKRNPVSNFYIIGKKGFEAIKKIGSEIVKFKYNDKNIGWGDIEELSKILLENYIYREYSKVTLIFSEYQSSLQQKIVNRKLLPVQFEAKIQGSTEVVTAHAAHEAREFLYEPTEKIVLNSMLVRHVKTQLYRAVLESQASEHGVRMVSMEMATNNAKDMIRSLTLLANKTRQAQITKEILEIVSGAEAIK